MRFSLAVSICACLLLSACIFRPYQIDVQQGNYIDRETIAKLKPQMTRAQVRFLLGTPLIADPFNPNRWDYLYYHRPGRRIEDVRRLTIYFEEDRMVRAYADAGVAPSAADFAAAASLPPPPAVAPEGAPYPVVEQEPRPAAQPAPTYKPPPMRSPVPPGRGQ
jgi:outer membrane protein assembly factor BamE